MSVSACGLSDDGAGRTLAVHRNRPILLPLSNCYSDGVGPRTFRAVYEIDAGSDAILTARLNGYSAAVFGGPIGSRSERWDAR